MRLLAYNDVSLRPKAGISIGNPIYNFFQRNLISLLLIITAFLSAAKDVVYAGQPTAFTHSVQPLNIVEQVAPEPIDLQAVQLEDQQRQLEGAPFRFAVPRPTRVTADANGTWEEIDNGTWLWRLRISSPGAVSLNLGFTRYHMPPGGSLFIYSADGNQILGPFTSRDEHHGQLWTPVVLSETIVVELTIPLASVPQLDLELTEINHGYRGFGMLNLEKSGSCNIDVICPEGNPWRDQIRSVGLIQLSGSFICTGALINNTAQDDTPYFLTANHCDINSGNAASMVVYWNFEKPSCGSGSGSLNQFQSGASFRSSYASSDFTLVELDDAPEPSFNVYFAGWSRSSAAPASAVAIHHPSTDEKSISFEYDPTSITSYGSNSSPGDGTHIRIADWDAGTTEPGSSGCPLFDPSKRIVGQLHGGGAACGNNNPDWFGRFYMSWTGGGTNSNRLSNWLDPLNTGATTLDGKNPSGGSACQAIENFETGDFNSFPWSHSGNAYWFITSGDKNSGIYSARAGAISDSQSTSLEVTIDCASGNISFYRKVSSELNYDYLKFFIDGIQKDSWSGSQAWAQVSYPVTAGLRTFKWTYSKDGSLSSGSDTAWIDDIAFPVECTNADCNTITIGTGTSSWTYPMHTYYHDSRTQVIYLASEIGNGRNIKALALNVETTPGQQMNNWTIRMKHTSMSSYGTASLESTGWTIVYQADVPIGNTGWRTFNFSTQFPYNGKDNLLVDFSHNNSSYTTNGTCKCSTFGPTRSAYAYSDSAYSDPLNWSGTTSPAVYGSVNVPNIQLTICGKNYIGDFDEDGDVDMSDLEMFHEAWLSNDPVIDIAPPGGDGIVNMLDFAEFAVNWLEGL